MSSRFEYDLPFSSQLKSFTFMTLILNDDQIIYFFADVLVVRDDLCLFSFFFFYLQSCSLAVDRGSIIKQNFNKTIPSVNKKGRRMLNCCHFLSRRIHSQISKAMRRMVHLFCSPDHYPYILPSQSLRKVNAE